MLTRVAGPAGCMVLDRHADVVQICRQDWSTPSGYTQPLQTVRLARGTCPCGFTSGHTITHKKQHLRRYLSRRPHPEGHTPQVQRTPRQRSRGLLPGWHHTCPMPTISKLEQALINFHNGWKHSVHVLPVVALSYWLTHVTLAAALQAISLRIRHGRCTIIRHGSSCTIMTHLQCTQSHSAAALS